MARPIWAAAEDLYRRHGIALNATDQAIQDLPHEAGIVIAERYRNIYDQHPEVPARTVKQVEEEKFIFIPCASTVSES